MAAASDLYARLTDTSESAHVDLGGTNERIAQCLSEFRYELLQVFFIDFKYLANETIEVIKISVPYEMFWESSVATEVITSVIKTISKVGEFGREQFCE